MTNTYIAKDGKEFATKMDCIVYENALEVIETTNNVELRQSLITIAEYCYKQISCWDCPMLLVGGCILKNKTPDYWLRLKKRTVTNNDSERNQ